MVQATRDLTDFHINSQNISTAHLLFSEMDLIGNTTSTNSFQLYHPYQPGILQLFSCNWEGAESATECLIMKKKITFYNGTLGTERPSTNSRGTKKNY